MTPPTHNPGPREVSAPEIRAEAFYQMADAAPMMIWMAGQDLRCFWFNRLWLNFTGRSMDEETGDGWLEGVHPEDVEKWVKGIAAAAGAREPVTMEYRLRSAAGGYRWFMVHGVPRFIDTEFVGYIGSCLDIRDRRETEHALEAGEESHRMLVESATEFAIMTFGRDGIIESWSDGAQRVFGYEEDEVLGKSFVILFTPEDRANGIPEREISTAHDQGKSLDERWHLRADGSRLYASGAVSRIRDSNPPKFVKIARDLTERKRMEDILQDTDRRKNEFIATLAHELRNPLAPIRTGLEILRYQNADPAVSAKLIPLMERQMDHIVRLVDDLLEVSRITQGKIRLRPEELDLNHIISSAVTACLSDAESARHRLTVSLCESPLWVMGDSVRLSQVVANLLTNAIKYTPSGGEIEVSCWMEDGCVVVLVRDNGIGIPLDMHSRIFEMFAQMEPAGHGSISGLGIGLSVVKTLVELHGGRISVSSRGRNLGSEFRLELPALEAPSSSGRSAGGQVGESGHHPPAAAGRRVLLVEDNADAGETLATALRQVGFDVRLAFDGSSALAMRDSFLPHICICDIGLPDTNGYQLARRFRLRDPALVLISLSGWGQQADRARSHEAGFSHHLIKPVKLEELWEALGHKSRIRVAGDGE